MPKPSPHKRSVVKHATRGGGPLGGPSSRGAARAGGTRGRGASATGRGGFHVGPKHAPDGSYLGRAKKIKAQLIEHAKVKKAFYKGPGAQSALSEAERAQERDEGKFAPQDPVAQKLLATDQAEGSRRRKQIATVKESSKDEAGSTKGEEVEARGAKRKRAEPQAPQEANKSPRFTANNTAQEGTSYKPSAPHRTREEATKQRAQKEKKAAKTNKRGQPNLGGRIELLLEKIGGGR